MAGSGCGVPGLMLAATLSSFSTSSSISGPSKIFLTDLNPQTVENVKHNIELNQLRDVEAVVIDWSNPSTWPAQSDDIGTSRSGRDKAPHVLCDVVLGSDLIYQKSLAPLLKSVVLSLLKPGGKFLYVAPDTGRDGMDEFLQDMKLQCPGWTDRIAPSDYHSNPLPNCDDEESFLHFQELYQKTYILYEFPSPKK